MTILETFIKLRDDLKLWVANNLKEKANISYVDNLFRKNTVYTATPETLVDVIGSVQAGATIQLMASEDNNIYGLINFHGKDSFPENLTIVGTDDITVAGVSITSGIISDTINSSSDISDAILPQGLTFRNINFTGNFSQKNSRIDNLTIDGCTFEEGCNIFINPEGFTDSYGSEIYSEGGSTVFGFTYRYPYCQVNQKNLTIKNCKIADGSTYIDPNNKSVASAIHVLGVKGVTITYNEISGGYNGIQVGGAETDYNVVAGGEITITKNIVKNTSSRGINVASVHSGEVIIAENTLNNINHKDKIISRYFKDTTIVYTINGIYHQHNTCDGTDITVNSGDIVEQDITVKTSNYDHKPNTYIVASSSKLLEVLPTVEAGATIKLKSGNYKLLTLSGNKSYPEDLTIIGEDGATIAGITITSGVRYEDGIDMDMVVMPKGLTLKNLTFTDKLNVINSDISDLSVINCHFDAKAFINCRASAFDAGGTRKGANETMSHNVLVKGCTFEASASRQYGMYMQAVDGAVFEDNTIDGATINGIFVTGIYANDKWSCGKFIVRNNTISNTTSEGIKFLCLKDASVYAMNNTLSSTSEVKGILASNCFGVTISEDGNTLNSEALVIAQSSVSSPADYIKSQIGLAAALKEKADKTDLDSKMDEGVLIYNGINDTDETGLNNWLDNTVMPTMANDTIRNISVRVGGAKGDGKGIIPWASLGTIHKRTSAYATIDVTAQINGKHYTKYRTDGKWSATACIEDKINLKADKSAMEAALANKADKADIENLYGNEVAIFDPSIEGGEDHPPVVMDWLDNKIIPSMTDNSIKYIYIPEAGFFYDTSAFNTLYELIGTVYKFDNNNIMINVFQADGTNIIKTKLNGAWKNPKNSQSVLNEKVSAVADVYKSVDDTDETKLNSWLETISDYSRGDSGEFLGMQDGSTKFISVNTPAVADGVLLWGTLYKHSYDSMTIDFISQEDGKRHIKIKTNGVWQDTLAISNSGQQDPGSNSETITNPQEMTEKELETWLEQEVLPIMADGSVRNISIRSSNLFDTYFGTSNDELGVGTIYKRDNDYVVLDLVSVFSGRHITKVKSPSSYPTYGPSDVGTGVWKPHMSITPYNYVNTKSECYTGEWDESKINDWLQNMGYDMTSNIAPPCMEYPTCVRNIEILHGPDNNRLIGTLYTYGLLDSDKIAHLTDYNTGKQYIKRRYMGVWEAMKEFNGSGSSDGVTEAQLEERLQEAMSSFDQVDNTSDLDKPISTATQAALDQKVDIESLLTHTRSKNNPHDVTKDQVGLGNIDNTADLDKPISTATQAALNAKMNKEDRFGSTGQYLTDFNALMPTGFYYSGAETANRPANVSAYSTVIYTQRTIDSGVQIILATNGHHMIIRYTLDKGASWTNLRIVTDSMFNYDTSTGTLNITLY